MGWPRKTSTTERCGHEVCASDRLFLGLQVHYLQAAVSCVRDSKELIDPKWHFLILITMTGNGSSALLGGFLEIKHPLQRTSHIFLVLKCNLRQKHYQVHVTSNTLLISFPASAMLLFSTILVDG